MQSNINLEIELQSKYVFFLLVKSCADCRDLGDINKLLLITEVLQTVSENRPFEIQIS